MNKSFERERITSFQAPSNFSGDNESSVTPLDMTIEAIHRSTLYWPLVISATAVYNVQSHLEPLLSIIIKPQITPDQVIECKKVSSLSISLTFTNESMRYRNMNVCIF